MRRSANASADLTQRLPLMATLAAALLCGVSAEAIASPTHPAAATPQKAAPAAPDDGLGPRDVYVEADNLVDHRESHLVTATGSVDIRYQGRSLKADKVVYDTLTGAAHAYGHLVSVMSDGSVIYADEAELDDQLRAGVALGFSARMQDNVSIVARAAIHRAETVNELKSARYTPCDICRTDGSAKEPTFSIEAQDIVEDRDHNVIYYRHAVIRVLGVPVLALPIFWHADPASKRRSGLLTPKIEYSKRRGLSYEQPFLWAISPASELIVSPQLNTAVNPLLNLRYREKFYEGNLDIRAGYTYDKLFDSHGSFGQATNRSYVLGSGAFNLDPRMTVGFGLERVTDPTLFRRYSIGQVFRDRGPFKTDTDRLVTQLYAQRQDSQSFLSLSALSYQSLRATLSKGVVLPNESSAGFPFVGPLLEARWAPTDPVLGGRLRVLGSAVALSRNNPVYSVTDSSGLNPSGARAYTPGTGLPTTAAALVYSDSRRLTTEADWRRDITTANGLRISPFAEARGDIYSISSGTLTSGVNYATKIAAKDRISRATGTIGADLAWPFIKPLPDGSIILEPMVQLAASPKYKPNPNIPNEDSASFEFDETTLFSTHRFTGYDLYESGARANVGGRATFDFGAGRSASALIGRTFRAEKDLAFSAVSGLQGTASDWVTAVTVTPLKGLSVFNRARFDANSWKVHREEAGVNYALGRNSISVRYRYDENGLVQVQCSPVTDPKTGALSCYSPFPGHSLVANGSTLVGKVENADLYATAFVTKHWGVTASVTRDLQTRIWPVAQLGVFYQDECVRLDMVYTHDETYSSVIGTSDSVVLRLTLATLGGTLGPGVRPNDSR